jgi:hypothetical protein
VIVVVRWGGGETTIVQEASATMPVMAASPHDAGDKRVAGLRMVCAPLTWTAARGFDNARRQGRGKGAKRQVRRLENACASRRLAEAEIYDEGGR